MQICIVCSSLDDGVCVCVGGGIFVNIELSLPHDSKITNPIQLCLTHYELEFVELACQSPAVVCCRCSPTHKAHVVQLLCSHTKKPVSAIGDGGNDVSMIQAANVGIGIVGKEGKQASLAADFSITSFNHISRLLVWHGRNRSVEQ